MVKTKKVKTRRISIEWKVLFTTIVLGIIASVFMGISLYQESYSNFVEESKKNVQGLVSVASKQIDGDLLEELNVGDEETETYQIILSILKEYLDGTDMEYAYTLKDCDKDNVQFIVDADTIVSTEL